MSGKWLSAAWKNIVGNCVPARFCWLWGEKSWEAQSRDSLGKPQTASGPASPCVVSVPPPRNTGRKGAALTRVLPLCLLRALSWKAKQVTHLTGQAVSSISLAALKILHHSDNNFEGKIELSYFKLNPAKCQETHILGLGGCICFVFLKSISINPGHSFWYGVNFNLI